MQQHIGPMVRPGIQATELHVRQSAHQGERLPVLCVHVALRQIRCEGPNKSLSAQTLR